MFGLFKKKTERQKLEEEYKRLQTEAFNLSKTNRTLADEKTYEAEQIAKKLDALND